MGDEKKRRPGMGYGVSPDAYNAYGSVISELAAKKQTAKPASASVETGVQQQQATTEQADSAVQNFANLPLGKKLETLKNSRKGRLRKLFGMGKTNSQRFDEVVRATEAVLTKTSGSVGGSPEQVRKNMYAVLPLYGEMIEKCNFYLARTARSYHGAMRQKQVKSIRDTAEQEIASVRSVIDQSGTMTQADATALTWDQIRAHSREMVIDLGDKGFESLSVAGGGQASTVYKIPGGNGDMSFFKEEENVVTKNTVAFAKGVRVGNRDNEDSANKRDLQETQNAKARLALDRSNLSAQALKIVKKYNCDLQRLSGDKILNSETKDPKVQDEIRRFVAANKVHQNTFDLVKGNMLSAAYMNVNGESGEINVSRRNVATSRIADLLGVGHLIARSQTAVIKSGNSEIRGNLMEGAKGKAAITLQERRFGQALVEQEKATGEELTFETFKKGFGQGKNDPKLQKDLTSLQVLDVLCGQQDRHVGNYFINQDANGNTTGVMGIDNDFSFGRFAADRQAEIARQKQAGQKANRNSGTHNRDVIQHGKIVLPHIDKQLAQNIIQLDDTVVQYALADLITPEEIKWTLIRLHELQDAFKKEMADPNSKVFLEKDSDWNESTHKELMAAGSWNRRAEALKKYLADHPNILQENRHIFPTIRDPKQRQERWDQSTPEQKIDEIFETEEDAFEMFGDEYFAGNYYAAFNEGANTAYKDTREFRIKALREFLLEKANESD